MSGPRRRRKEHRSMHSQDQAALAERLKRPTALGVHLVKSAQHDGALMIRVSLSSNAKPGLKSQGYVDPNHEKVREVVGITAGAAAEHQCSLYGDRHDPDLVAREARRLFDELRKIGEQANAKIEGVAG